MVKIIWHNEKRKISELIPTENNPRQLTEKQKKDLKQSISKFDLAEIPAINTNNKILAGHMRLKILQEIKGDIEIDVRVPNRELTEKEAQEYLIRSNKNTGEWDMDILANAFEIDDLKDWGFEDFDLGIDVSKYNNEEIDINSFEDKMVLKFELSENNYQIAKSKLDNISNDINKAFMDLINGKI